VKEPLTEKAIIPLSGGIDSAVCLWWARNRGWETHGITFNYYRRNPREVQAAELLAKAIDAKEYRSIDIPFLREVSDTPDFIRGPIGDNVPPSYVPARNIVFYGIAAWWAEILDADWIVGGHNLSDRPGYPDSRPEFIGTMNRAISLGTFIGQRKPLRIITPLASLSKTEVVRMALDLGVPLHLTWSCNGTDEKPCGRCEACGKRRTAFAQLGVNDPAGHG
jgi:7-cyano-7-deazaguanine synthase